MSRFMLILLVIGLSACAPQPTSVNTVEPTQSLQIPIPSDWAGAVSYTDGTVESMIVHLTETNGTLNIEPETQVYELREMQRFDSTISFNVTLEHETSFSGEFDGLQIIGEIEGDGQTGTFILLPLFSESRESLVEFPGTYQFESGEALLINLAPEFDSSGLYFFGQGLMVTHFGTGAIRALYQIGGDTFLVGRTRAMGYPFEAQVTFQRDADGSITALIWQTRDPASGKLAESQPAHRLDLDSEVVHFTSEDGTDLTGHLTLPATPGPHPAIMMLHGSEPGTKDNFSNEQMRAFMASQGIAILNYDKRGAGESEGSYVEAASETNLSLTAQDAIAGVEFLKSRSEIKPDQIGLIGFSQAGWVIPLAASQSEDITYFIILSGPVTSVGHEGVYSSYTNDGEGEENYSQEEISTRLANTPHSGFDSTPIIAVLDQPGLWLWGDQDKSLPFFESEAALKEIIAQRKSNFSYMLLANADHNLQQTTQGLFNEIPYSPGYHEDYYETIMEWLEQHVK
jgi:dienelactone hydrolase